MVIRPERLCRGDTVGILAPAGPVQANELDRGVQFFINLGLRVVLGNHVCESYGYLAGTDEKRLQDLHEMFGDPNVKAIFCARGGYGTERIASRLDLEWIRKNPKIFWGYSDITYLHTIIRQETGLVTFHGPMVTSDIADSAFDALSAGMFHQLFYPTQLCYTEAISPLNVLVPGESTGKLIGGNLSLLVRTLGTPWELLTTGMILVIEDIGEEVYRLDAMFNQLRLAGKLENLAGVIIGDFNLTDAKQDPSSLSLRDVLRQYLGALQCPVMSGFKFGHCSPNVAIPLGATATLSTRYKTLVIEPGVS